MTLDNLIAHLQRERAIRGSGDHEAMMVEPSTGGEVPILQVFTYGDETFISGEAA